MDNNSTAIKVENVSKAFKLPHEKQSSIKGLFVSMFHGKRTYERQQVLKNINFEIKKGEFFGIVGRNGSGKSTMLKTLAGIYTPDSGHIQINGKLTPFIELGVGFNPDLTGRENVFLNGALLGFNREEMLAMYDEIVKFAELDKFMDQKLKNYSSGMQVRLAFAIAIQAKSEILLLDEVLAVGDQNFQKKCFNYFAQLKKEGRTVILVSHDMEAVKQYCDRAILLHNGEIAHSGETHKVTEVYYKLNIEKQQNDTKDKTKLNGDRKKEGTRLLSIRSIDSSGKQRDIVPSDEDIIIEMSALAGEDLKSPTLGLVILNELNQSIFATNTPTMKIKLKDLKEGETVTGRFNIRNIYTDGTYWLSGAISNSVETIPREAYDRVERISSFSISGREMKASLTHPDHSAELFYKRK